MQRIKYFEYFKDRTKAPCMIVDTSNDIIPRKDEQVVVGGNLYKVRNITYNLITKCIIVEVMFDCNIFKESIYNIEPNCTCNIFNKNIEKNKFKMKRGGRDE